MTGGLSEAESYRRQVNRTLWRIMPLTIMCSVIGTIDRTNIGFAKLGMRGDLGITEAAFALGASLFYLGYVLFEIPSAMGNARYGARKWFARIMISWSVVTLLLVVVRSTEGFYVLRFLLGAAEAGIYPAQLYYVTLWFPQEERPRAIGYLTLGSAFGNGLSALLCGALLDLDGLAGFAGWQWIFLVTGCLPIVMTVLVLRYLPDSPAEATFLSAEEKARLTDRFAADTAHHAKLSGIWQAIWNPKVLGFGLLYAVLLGSLYSVIYWAPSVFAPFKLTGAANGLLVALPWAFDAVLLVLVAGRLRAHRSVLTAMILFAVVGLVSYAVGAVGDTLTVQALALLFAIPATSLCLGFFWTLPVRHFSGTTSAATIGAISTLGNLGGVLALNSMPAIARIGGSTSSALLYPCVGMLIVLAAAVAMLAAARRAAAAPAP